MIIQALILAIVVWSVTLWIENPVFIRNGRIYRFRYIIRNTYKKIIQ